jgi:hypothetical protein
MKVSRTATPSSPLSVAEKVVPGRRVIPHRGLDPLPPARRYVQPAVSHVSVFTGLFAWAIRANHRGPSRRVRVARGSFGPDGLTAPTECARGRFKFKNYFEFGAGRTLHLFGDQGLIPVHRNRAVFVLLLLAAVLYSLLATL